MTTTAKVVTHAWPVEVTTIDTVQGEDGPRQISGTTVVAPHTQQDFHLTNTRELHFKELAIPESPAIEG